MLDYVEIGKRLIELRKNCGWTQDDLAGKLHTSRQNLSKWETGKAPLPIDVIHELYHLFSVSADYILCFDNTKDVICKRGVDIFRGYEDARESVVEKIIHNWYKGNLHEVFCQFTPQERMRILRGIREGTTYADKKALDKVLYPNEKVYLGGLQYEIRESNH